MEEAKKVVEETKEAGRGETRSWAEILAEEITEEIVVEILAQEEDIAAKVMVEEEDITVPIATEENIVEVVEIRTKTKRRLIVAYFFVSIFLLWKIVAVAPPYPPQPCPSYISPSSPLPPLPSFYFSFPFSSPSLTCPLLSFNMSIFNDFHCLYAPV